MVAGVLLRATVVGHVSGQAPQNLHICAFEKTALGMPGSRALGRCSKRMS